MNTLRVKTAEGGYDIIFQRGGLSRVAAFWGDGCKSLIVTDDGVPAEYAATVAAGLTEARVLTLPQGEATKQLQYLEQLWQTMVEMELTRSDRVIAVGGGVMGDLAGLAAATYMRGIAFYNIPTTVLAQVDSSVGGKTAIDFGGYKNLVGAFWPPKGVLIDTDTLRTLSPRHRAAGLAEAIKMAACYDAELFAAFEEETEELEPLLQQAVAIKAGVVERDEREAGERKVLNFGHTLAHALESKLSFDELYHGECVALGMLPMCAPAVRARLIAVLAKWGLPTRFPLPLTELAAACRHDKKMAGKQLQIVYVPAVGQYEIRSMTIKEFTDFIGKAEQI